MKAFKATYNMKCKELTYEVGKTYSISNIEICNHGLHYCKNMKDVLKYYSYTKDFALLEIEDLGNTITDKDKSVTNKFKVIRVIPKEEYTFDIPIEEYDANNNLIHYKDSNGLEYWQEYDSNNNLIHYKNSYGSEEWQEWDSNNNLIHYKNSYGSEWFVTID
jgi:YD repeat-containing protein